MENGPFIDGLPGKNTVRKKGTPASTPDLSSRACRLDEESMALQKTQHPTLGRIAQAGHSARFIGLF